MSQRPSLLTSTQLKERGWTPTLVKKFLDPPDATKPNPHYKSASPMRLYALARVEAVEVADAFQQAYAKAAARSLVGKTVAARNAAELVAQAEQMHIRVQLQALGKVQDQAIDAYNDFHEELLFERGHEYEPASVMSDPIFLDRITVNYIRHELTEYDESLEEVAGKIGVSLAVATIRRRVYTEIAAVYPDLAQECERQVLARLGLGEKAGEL